MDQTAYYGDTRDIKYFYVHHRAEEDHIPHDTQTGVVSHSLPHTGTGQTPVVRSHVGHRRVRTVPHGHSRPGLVERLQLSTITEKGVRRPDQSTPLVWC